MHGQSWGPIFAGAVMIPIAAGWSYYGGVSVLLCHGCGKQIPTSSRFCPNCGVDLYGVRPSTPVNPSYCTECGRPLKVNAKFCGSCGTSVL